MIQIQLELAGESRAHLARLEREAPRTFRGAHAAAATYACNRLRKIVREFGGPKYGIPKFAPRHEMTTMIAPWRRPFGRLADKESIVCFKRGEGQVVGWVDNLAGWASGVQGAARHEFEARHRAALHLRYHALDGYRIPTYYDRPARLVIAPFAEHLQKEFPAMVLERFNSKVAGLLKKGKVVR